MHRNLLLPCDYLPIETEGLPIVKPKRNNARPVKAKKDSEGNTEEDDEDDDYFMDMSPQVSVRAPCTVTEQEEIRHLEKPASEATQCERNYECQDTGNNHLPEVNENLYPADEQSVEDVPQSCVSNPESETE